MKKNNDASQDDYASKTDKSGGLSTMKLMEHDAYLPQLNPSSGTPKKNAPDSYDLMLEQSSWTFGLYAANVLLMISAVVLCIVFAHEPLANIWISLGQNTFINKISVYTFYSSFRESKFMGGVVFVFMFGISALANLLASMSYVSHSQTSIRDWSHGTSTILYSIVMALGFLIYSCVAGNRADLILICSFLVIIAASIIFVMTQMNFAALPYSPKNSFDVLVTPILAIVFQLVPYIVVMVQFCSYLTNNDPDVRKISRSGIALVIGGFIWAVLFYIPMIMSMFTRIRWITIDTTFAAMITAFNIYMYICFYCWVLE